MQAPSIEYYPKGSPKSSLYDIHTAYNFAVGAARIDPVAFCKLSLSDEETGGPIYIQQFQQEWFNAIAQFKNVVIWAHPESGKTLLLGVGRILWLLGLNPRKRYAILSATNKHAKKVIKAIRDHITNNKVIRDVFEGRLQRGDSWEKTAIEVARPYGIRDPSVQAFSPEGTIQGSRLDGLFIDDVLTENNTRIQSQREKIIEWIRSSAFSRLGRDAWVVVTTNAWHPRDMAHIFEKEGWWAKRYPVIYPDGRLQWEDRWPLERIENEKIRLGPLEFSRQMLCQARDESTARFKREWIDHCLEKGQGYSTYRSLRNIIDVDHDLADEIGLDDDIIESGGLPEGFWTITGVDLAVSKKSSADLSVLFTILLWPNGLRQVLEIQAGRWSGPEIIDRIVSAHERFHSVAVVENNAAQDYLLQWIRDQTPGMPIKAFTTGRNKLSVEYGVESLGAELAAGMWLIPCGFEDYKVDSQISEWIIEMLNYDPKAHTGDRLMACICPGHRVTTLRGSIPIEDVIEGDVVLTHKGNWRSVLCTSCRDYNGGIVSIRASGGIPVVMTDDHPVFRAFPKFNREDRSNRLIPDANSWGFTRAKELRSGRKLAGDYVYSPGIYNHTSTLPVIDLSEFVREPQKQGGSWDVSEKFLVWRDTRCPRKLVIDDSCATLIGLYLAEGFVRGKGTGHQVGFAFNRRERHLVSFVKDQASRLFGANSFEELIEGHGGVTVAMSSVIAARFFRGFGSREHKKIPWAWLRHFWPGLLSIVRGWTLGDCHWPKGKGGIKGVTIALEWAKQLRLILRTSGIATTECVFKQPGVFRGKPCNHRPTVQIALTERDSRILTKGHSLSIEHFGNRGKPRVATNARAIADNRGLAVRVAALDKSVYEGKVYNLTVDGDESFVVEDIAVHNCWFVREFARKLQVRSRSPRRGVSVIG